MRRRIRPELLDELPPTDTRSLRARRDLKRVNGLMGHAPLMAEALSSCTKSTNARRLVELGAGDGSFLARVARRLGAGWRDTEALLLDRVSIVAPETIRAFQAQSWRMHLVQADVPAWLDSCEASGCDAMLANLFLHHFHEPQLRQMLGAAARHTRLFIAIEPRRSVRNLFLCQLLGLAGCSHVTRHDARVSVRAGFARSELADLWPQDGSWLLDEGAAGTFSHLFIARRRD